MVNNLDNKLNVFFSYFSNLDLDKLEKINQCQLRSKLIFNFNI